MEFDERVIRDFNDRGLIWLFESPSIFGDLVKLLSAELAAKLDFSRAERINRSLVPDTLYKQEADLIYQIPYLKEKGEVLVTLISENQSRPDRQMWLRYLSYEVRIWEQQKRLWEDSPSPRPPLKLTPIIPILIYTGGRAWNPKIHPSDVMDLLPDIQEFVPQYKTIVLNLRKISASILELSDSNLARLFLVLKSVEAPLETLTPLLTDAVRALEMSPLEKDGECIRALHFLLLLVRHKRSVDEREPLFEQIAQAGTTRREEIKNMVRTDAQVLMEQGAIRGKAEGKMEGKMEGKVEGKAEGRKQMFLALLDSRFGTVPAETLKRVLELPDSLIDPLFKEALNASSLLELGL